MRTIMLTAALLLGTTVAQAQYGMPPGMGYGPVPGGAYGRGAPQTDTGPAAELRRGMDGLLAFLGQDPQPSAEQLEAFLRNAVAPYFDFAYMAKVAGGQHYRHMNEQQRARMAAKLEETFLVTMASKLANYQNQQVRYLGTRVGEDGKTASANVALLNPRGYPSKLSFRLYQGKDGWKVYDVAANGQSAVMHYRREFRQTMRGLGQPYGRQYPQGMPRPSVPAYR